MISEKLAPSRIRLGSSTIGRKAWHLSLWENGGMLEACKRMLPFLDKKRVQVKTLLDYVESRITANDALRTFNLTLQGKVGRQGAKFERAVDQK